MNWKSWMPLAVAIVLGLIAAKMALEVVTAGPTQVEVAANLSPMVVAVGEVEPGVQLNESHLRIGRVEGADRPVGAFDSVAQVVGRVAKVALTPNQPILPSLLADEKSTAGKGAVLPEGMRAITVEINSVSGVAGFIQPKSRVDIVATLQSEGKPLAKTVLENIEVFAVGSRTIDTPPAEKGAPVEAANTVTLLVTPEQGEKLELATSSSRVRMVLRNSSDQTSSMSDGVTIADLKGEKASNNDPFQVAGELPTGIAQKPLAGQTAAQSSVIAPRAKDQWTVEIIRAGQTSQQVFEIETPKTVSVEKPAEPKSDKTLMGNLFGFGTNE